MNLGAVFLIGETSSLVTLMFDTTSAWLSWVLGIIVFGCFFTLSRAVTLMPLIRFMATPRRSAVLR